MKVCFNASPRSQDLSLVKNIYEKISDLGHKHTFDSVLEHNPNTFYNATDTEWQIRYKSMINGIAKADVCIFECSVYSFAMGQLIQESINREKPVIVLYLSNFKPYLLRGAAEVEKRLIMLEYNKDTIYDVLKYGLDEAKELLSIRFTMLLTPEYTKHLDFVNKNEGISRSDYIRKLIKKDFEKEG